jgi:hypothetical protein
MSNIIPNELKSLQSITKFNSIDLASLEGAFIFDAPFFNLHLGNDLSPDDGDYWRYVNIKNDLNLPIYHVASREILQVYYLSEKTIERAKIQIDKFSSTNPKSLDLIIPFTAGRDFSIVSFALFPHTEKKILETKYEDATKQINKQEDRYFLKILRKAIKTTKSEKK